MLRLLWVLSRSSRGLSSLLGIRVWPKLRVPGPGWRGQCVWERPGPTLLLGLLRDPLETAAQWGSLLGQLCAVNIQ